MSGIRGPWGRLIRSQQHDENERRAGGSAMFGPVTGFDTVLYRLYGGHVSSIGPTGGGKRPASSLASVSHGLWVVK